MRKFPVVNNLCLHRYQAYSCFCIADTSSHDDWWVITSNCWSLFFAWYLWIRAEDQGWNGELLEHRRSSLLRSRTSQKMPLRFWQIGIWGFLFVLSWLCFPSAELLLHTRLATQSFLVDSILQKMTYELQVCAREFNSWCETSRKIGKGRRSECFK